MIEYVRKTYGEKNVAQIITFGTMAAKAVLKDAGRALDMPYGEVDKIAKMIPTTLNIALEDALKQTPQLESLRKTDERVKELVEVALRLEGLARHASTHAAGVVISPQPLTEIVPLYKSNKDEITTQYDMNALERIGLLKMDFLGLTTLTVLDDAVRLIKQNRGVTSIWRRCRSTTQATYALFSRGDTTGIFQFESHGMRDILRRYQPTRLEDLTALNALYRPGPIQGGMIDDFIARKHGKKKVTYDLPELEEILVRNLGRDCVSGTGDADRQPPGGILAGRRRPAAPRHGQEEARRDGGAAREIPDRMRGAQSAGRKRPRRFSI